MILHSINHKLKAMDNKIDFQIPQEVIDSVTTHLTEAATALKPYLIALTPEERIQIPKISDGTVPFVYKVKDYSASNSEFCPAYMNTEGMNNDMEVFNELTNLFRITEQLYNSMSDTMMEAGGESYICALSYYNSVKQASKMGIPGAKGIYEDLAKRFNHSKRQSSDADPSNN